jgi:hypothetical protein
MNQFHSGLARGSARLMTVTGYTGANHIFPGMFAAPVPRENMVQSKLPGFPTTILAGILVTVKNLKAGQLPLRSRTPNHVI